MPGHDGNKSITYGRSQPALHDLQLQTAPMDRILDLYCVLLKGVIALCLAVMVVLVGSAAQSPGRTR